MNQNTKFFTLWHDVTLSFQELIFPSTFPFNSCHESKININKESEYCPINFWKKLMLDIWNIYFVIVWGMYLDCCVLFPWYTNILLPNQLNLLIISSSIWTIMPIILIVLKCLLTNTCCWAALNKTRNRTFLIS